MFNFFRGQSIIQKSSVSRISLHLLSTSFLFWPRQYSSPTLHMSNSFLLCFFTSKCRKQKNAGTLTSRGHHTIRFALQIEQLSTALAVSAASPMETRVTSQLYSLLAMQAQSLSTCVVQSVVSKSTMKVFTKALLSRMAASSVAVQPLLISKFSLSLTDLLIVADIIQYSDFSIPCHEAASKSLPHVEILGTLMTLHNMIRL